MIYGIYEVAEGHTYRGHQSGDLFEARMDRRAEPKAVERGVLRLLDTTTPTIAECSYSFPDGWLASPNPSTEAREGLFH